MSLFDDFLNVFNRKDKDPVSEYVKKVAITDLIPDSLGTLGDSVKELLASSNLDLNSILSELPTATLKGLQLEDAFNSLSLGIIDELQNIDPSKLLTPEGRQEILNKIKGRITNDLQGRAEDLGNGVVQELKDTGRGILNAWLSGKDPFSKDVNLGVTDRRLQYAFAGTLDIDKRFFGKYFKTGSDVPIFSSSPEYGGESTYLKGVRSVINTYEVFRLHRAASGGTLISHDDVDNQSELLLDKEGRRSYFAEYVKDPSIGNILTRFANNDKKPYKPADFLWCKWYDIYPTTHLITLRRYMYPVADNNDMSSFLKSGSPDKPKSLVGNWGMQPTSQMITYFGGETGNSLSEILTFNMNIPYNEDNVDDLTDYTKKMTLPDLSKVYNAFQNTAAGQILSSATNAAASLAGGVAGGLGKKLLSMSNINKISGISNKFSGKLKNNIDSNYLVELAAVASGLISPESASGLQSILSHYDPYEHGGYLSDRPYGPINTIRDYKKRQAGITGGFGEITINFAYVSKSIGHLNVKSVMLDILSNVMATTFYHAPFYGGSYRYFLDNGKFPLGDQEYIIELYKGNYKRAAELLLQTTTNALEPIYDKINGVVESVSNSLPSNESLNSTQGVAQANASTGYNIDSGKVFENMLSRLENINGIGGKTQMSDRIMEYSQMQMLASLIPSTIDPNMIALKTGAPIGYWHLTVGNPFRPIAVIGNLICKNTVVTFSEELGADDFPKEFNIRVTLSQGMSRSSSEIQSAFNDGYGRMYYPVDPQGRPTQNTEEGERSVIESQNADSSIGSTFDPSKNAFMSTHVPRFEGQTERGK